MTEIYVVRHGEAEGNLYRRIHGVYNSMLTHRGMEQLDYLVRRFKDVHIDAVYSSDLTRAKETVGAVAADHGLEVVTSERLREVCLGIWEDMCWGEADLFYRQQMRWFALNPELFSVQDGERLGDAGQRLIDFMLELEDRHPGQTVMIGSHGTVIKYMLTLIQGKTLSQHRDVAHGDNTCVALLRLDGGRFHIEYMNDASHLPDEMSRFRRQKWQTNKDGADADNLRFRRVDAFSEGKELNARLRQCHAEQFGGDFGFSELSRGEIERRSGPDGDFLMWALQYYKKMGIVELDPEPLAEDGVGLIKLYYIFPECRGNGYGVQLLGQAVSTYRRLGRHTVRIVLPEDHWSRDYFIHFGFSAKSAGGQLLMDMDIKQR
ncbi:MAG: histidine phosphatase family protein [Oscillospiraceae bacterium]|nr:histidine phosphatase family protein [Oscillospiraceae bacterium]